MSAIEIECPSCGAKLRAGAGLIGKTVDCPKCHKSINVSQPPSDIEPAKSTVVNTVDGKLAEVTVPAKRRRYRPATDKQKAFATELGIEFAPDVNAHDISIMIDKALDREYETDKDKVELRLKTLSQCDESEMLAELQRRGSHAFMITWKIEEEHTDR